MTDYAKLRDKIERAIRNFDDPGSELAYRYAEIAADAVKAELAAITEDRDLWKASEAACSVQYDKLRAEMANEKAHYETAQANWDICLDENTALRADNAALREGLLSIKIEAQREQGRWVHLKRVIMLQCSALLEKKP